MRGILPTPNTSLSSLPVGSKFMRNSECLTFYGEGAGSRFVLQGTLILSLIFDPTRLDAQNTAVLTTRDLVLARSVLQWW